MDLYDRVVARTVERGGTTLALGGLDSGKTSFCRMCAAVAVRLGRTVAYVDSDVGQSAVGPPTTIGLKYISSAEDLESERLARADAIYFVGATSPKGHMLPMVIGAMKLVEQARAAGADLIVVDTTGFIHGAQGQVLKIHRSKPCGRRQLWGFNAVASSSRSWGASAGYCRPRWTRSASIRPSTPPASRTARRIARKAFAASSSLR